jgi:hypothetical protein
MKNQKGLLTLSGSAAIALQFFSFARGDFADPLDRVPASSLVFELVDFGLLVRAGESYEPTRDGDDFLRLVDEYDKCQREIEAIERRMSNHDDEELYERHAAISRRISELEEIIGSPF